VTALRGRLRSNVPLSAQLSASVAPPVKANAAAARGPIARSTCFARDLDRRRRLAAPARRRCADWRISPRSTGRIAAATSGATGVVA
jgi:hypothetical protein